MPATKPTSTDSRQSSRLLRQAVFLAFFGFMLVVLNCLVDPAAIDGTLIPRLLAISAFLLATVIAVCTPPIARLLDDSVLARPIVRLSAGYLAVTCGSLLVAVNVSAGFTDVFRTLATFLTLCLSCLLLPIVPRWREQLLQLFVIAGTIAVAVGWYEIVTQLGIGIHGRRAMEQITGLMSNVNLYAGMLVLILPWCACGTVLLRGAWRPLAALAVAGILATVCLLQSRAAWIAVLAGAAATAGGLIAWHTSFGLSRRDRNALAAVCLGAATLFAGGIAIAPADNPLVQRFRSIFVSRADSAAPPREGGRLMIWAITCRMIADHPLTGVGAGNFTVRLHEYFGGDDLDFSNVHTNWSEPHNDFLWVFAEKGVLGMLCFTGCFIAALAAIRGILRRNSQPADRWLALTTFAGLASYAAFSCFDFPLDRINHQVAFAVLLAVVTVLAHAGQQPPGHRAAECDRAWPARLAAAGLAAAALGLGIVYSLAALRQEKDVIVARRAFRQGRWEEMLAAAQRARTPWKTLDPLVSPVAFLEGMAQVRLGNLPAAIECLEQARNDNPNRMYVINNLGILYARTGRWDEAIECFSLAAERYPHRIEPFNNLAGCLIESGRPAEAVELLEQIPDEVRSAGVRRNLELARERAAAEPAAPEAE